MSAHHCYPPDPDSTDRRHCLWPAALVAGRRTGAAFPSREGRWWR